MKRLTLLFIIIASVQLSAHSNGTDTSKFISEQTVMTDSVLRHVVLFKFKDATPDEKLKEIEAAFGALPSKIKEIQDYEWGLNNSPEGLNKGLTHCFFVTFKNEKGRDIYLPHPDHKAFVDLASPYIEDVTVVDYWTK